MEYNAYSRAEKVGSKYERGRTCDVLALHVMRAINFHVDVLNRQLALSRVGS